MKKLLLVLLAIVSIVLVSCGDGSNNEGSSSKKSPKKVLVTLHHLDDYFTVKSYELETDVAEKGIDNLKLAKGSITLVLKRNNEEMQLKPSDIKWATIYGSGAGCRYYVFRGEIDGLVKQLVKAEPNTEETYEIPIEIVDPYNEFSSQEENQTEKQAHYDALTGVKGALTQISFDITLQSDFDY